MTNEEKYNLISALQAALSAVPSSRSTDYALDFSIMALRDDKSRAIPELVRLLNVIQGIQELSIFDHATQFGPMRSMPVTYYFLVQWLISRAQHANPDVSVSDLQNYLTTKEFAITAIVAFDGIQLDEECSLGEIQLIPWRVLPMSDTKYQVGVKAFYSHVKPDAVVVCRVRVPRLHLMPWDRFPPPFSGILEPMFDAIRCVGAISGGGTRLIHYWYEPPEDIPWRVELGTFGVDNSTMCHPVMLPVSKFQDVVNAWHRFSSEPETTKERLRIPMDRLNKSRLHGISIVDAAIELGIALESLFGPVGENEKIAAVLRRRASNSINGSSKDRTRIRNLIHDAYDLRSRAVHKGKVDCYEVGSRWSDHAQVLKLLNDTQDFVSTVLSRFLVEGVPSWDGNQQ